jgi:hypothetical protein
MLEDSEIGAEREGVEDEAMANHQAGDGLHHAETHEDEGGGYYTKHTHPDGKVEEDTHPTYDDAKDWQDERFGAAKGDDEDMPDQGEGGGDMSEGRDSYSRSCS